MSDRGVDITGDGADEAIDLQIRAHVDGLIDDFKLAVEAAEELQADAEAYTNLLASAGERMSAIASLNKENKEIHEELLSVVQEITDLHKEEESSIKERTQGVERMAEVYERIRDLALETSSIEAAQAQYSEPGVSQSVGGVDLGEILLNSPTSDILSVLRTNIGGRIAANVPNAPGLGGLVSGLRGGMAGMALPAAGVGLALAGGNLAYNQFQSAHEYSRITGGTSVGESIEYDMQARLAGLSPFMSTAEAQRAINTTLRQGYNRDLYTDASSFLMASTQDGIDPQRAMQMFNTNVVRAGSSLVALEEQIDALRETASETDLGFEQLLTRFQTGSATLEGRGAGVLAGSTAMELAQTWGASPELQDIDFNAMLGNRSFEMELSRQLSQELGRTVLPRELTQVFDELQSSGGDITLPAVRAVQSGLRRRFGWGPGTSRDEIIRRSYELQRFFQRWGLNMTEMEAVQFAEEQLNNDPEGQITENREKAVEEHRIKSLTPEEAFQRGMSLTEDFGWSAATGSRNMAMRHYKSEVLGRNQSLPLLEQWIDEKDPNIRDWRYVDQEGNVGLMEDLLTQGSYEDLVALESGVYQMYRTKKDSDERHDQQGENMTMAELFQSQIAQHYAENRQLYELVLSPEAEVLARLIQKNPQLEEFVHDLGIDEDALHGLTERSEKRGGG